MEPTSPVGVSGVSGVHVVWTVAVANSSGRVSVKREVVMELEKWPEPATPILAKVNHINSFIF